MLVWLKHLNGLAMKPYGRNFQKSIYMKIDKIF